MIVYAVIWNGEVVRWFTDARKADSFRDTGGYTVTAFVLGVAPRTDGSER